ncbi:MAG: hypothetical protein PUJ48_06100 [Subdoligranulum variabile]|uniref:hypothetical protein n=1 Tax=Gemmiger sp. TaxID=2049027 RepID=UPI002A90C289|nr:hypothetical protein [Gemmiger sp.]MDD7639757.1 hypothetical protein [Subdoligranulum variabile]MDY5604924.1 hypothetical protein [Gemmiger sp.]
MDVLGVFAGVDSVLFAAVRAVYIAGAAAAFNNKGFIAGAAGKFIAYDFHIIHGFLLIFRWISAAQGGPQML